MSRRIVLIGMAAVLVVVVGVAVWFTINPPAPTEEELAETTEEEQRVEISRFELDLIKEMIVDSPNGRLRLIREGEDWLIDRPYQVELDPSAVDDLTYSFARLYSEKIIEKDAADLSVYGLAPPVATARVESVDQGPGPGGRVAAGEAQGDLPYLTEPHGDPEVVTTWLHGRVEDQSAQQLRDPGSVIGRVGLDCPDQPPALGSFAGRKEVLQGSRNLGFPSQGRVRHRPQDDQ